MKCFTGDESGLVKAITIPKTSSQNEEKPLISTWGEINRDQSIQMMCQVKISGEQKQIVVARKNGSIQILDPFNEGNVCQEFTEDHISSDTKFIGLYANNNILVTCTNTGMLRYQPIDIENHSSINKSITLTSDLCRLRVHPKENHIFACGGKERDLSVWDINSNEEKIITKNNGLKTGMIWNGKNVKNDFLDLRIPIWITDLQFLSDQDITKIVTGTKYNQIRIYDIKAQRRPVFDASIGCNPVVSLIIGRNSNEIIFSDTIGNVFSVDTRTGKILGQFKGFAGSVTSLSIENKSSSLVTVCMDRFLRVHEMGATRKLVNKLYLKQRLTCVMVDNTEENVQIVKEKSQEMTDSEDEIWKNLKNIQTKPKKRKITKKIK